MKKKYFPTLTTIVTMSLVFMVSIVLAQNTAIYKTQGGAELVVADGGTITVESGGTITAESGSVVTIPAGTIAAASLAAGSLGAGVIASSIAVGAVYTNALLGDIPDTKLATLSTAGKVNASAVTGAFPVTVTSFQSSDCEALTPTGEGQFCYDTTTHIQNASTGTVVGAFAPMTN